MIRTVRQILCVAAIPTILAVTAAQAKDMTVAIDNFAFTPAKITVKAGTKVLFVNHDDIPHSIVAADGKVRSKALDTDESFAFTFDKPGDFVYFCGLHPHMKGEIKVEP